MNKKTAVRFGRNHLREGVGAGTILMALATLVVIFYSIYSSFIA